MSEEGPVDLRGSPLGGTVNDIEIASFCREHRILKQVDNCLGDIQNYVLKQGMISVYPRCLLSQETFTNLKSRCEELSSEGLAYVARSLAVSANLGEGTVDLRDSKFDVFLLMKGKPLTVLTVIDNGSDTKNCAKYNSDVAKEMIFALRRYTIEHISCAFGVVHESDLSDTDDFKDIIKKILEESTAFATPESLNIPLGKYKTLARAFLMVVAATSFARMEEQAEWFLTLNQFKVLTENLDREEIPTNVHPGSGGRVLLFEVARRLERLGPTLIISDREDIHTVAREKKVCTETVLLKNVSRAQKDFKNVVLYCNREDIPKDFIRASKHQKLWIFHPVKEPQGRFSPVQEGLQVVKREGYNPVKTEPQGRFSPVQEGLQVVKREGYNPVKTEPQGRFSPVQEGLQVVKREGYNPVKTEPQGRFSPVQEGLQVVKREGYNPVKTGNDPQTSMKNLARTSSPVPYTDFKYEEDLPPIHDPLRNVIDATENRTHQFETTTHISTYAERSGIKMLKRHGLVLLKGRSGSGKSSLGLSLLLHIQKETGRVPILLSSTYQWDLIPKDQKHCVKYVAMIDDIFGTSTFLQSRFDDWEKMFANMWPSVECGKIFLVITTRTEISKQCEKRLMRYQLFKKIVDISLDDGQYALRPCEKEKLIKHYCGKNMTVSEQDMKGIITAETVLGFPQSCQFYANSKEAQAMGVKFFTSPYKFLISEVICLREDDPLGYLVLLLVMLMDGCLELSFLKPLDGSVHFRNLVATLRQIVNLSMVPTKEQIRSKANSFCGVYLRSSERGYKFQHQSVFDSVFLSITQDHPEVCIKMCSADILVKLVRTTQKKKDEITMYLQKKDYCILASKVTDLLLADCVDILDHPCFSNNAFVTPLIDYWKEGKLQTLVIKTYPEAAKKSMNEVPFEYKAFLSYVILKGINTIPKMLLLSKDKSIISMCGFLPLQEILACAIFVFQMDLVNALLGKGVIPDENCFRALCAAHVSSDFLIDKVFERTQIYLEQTMDHGDLLLMNVVQGKYHAVDLMVKKMEELQVDKDVYSQCLIKLFETLSNSENKRAQHIKEIANIIKTLIDTECSVDYNNLMLKAASHENATALKLLLQKDVDVNHRCDGSCPIHQACMFGGSECLSELLKNGANVELRLYERGEKNEKGYLILYLAAKTTLESKEKVEHILEHFKNRKTPGLKKKKRLKTDILEEFVNETCKDGLSPLHGATESGNIDSIKLLVQSGAKVNSQDEKGETPLHVAVKNNRKKCVSLLLKRKAEINLSNLAGNTPLHYAAENANINIVELLLKEGANVKLDDPNGRTCLHKTIGCGDCNILDALIEAGSDINFEDKNGETVLHKAALVEDMNIFEFLCDKGAKIDRKDKSGQSVVHKVAGSSIDALEKLQYLTSQKMVDVSGVDENGRSALFSAAKSGDPEVVEFLQEKGLVLKENDDKNNTILHAACEVSGNNRVMIDYLLGEDLDPSIKGTEGNTALLLNLINQKVLVDSLITDSTVNTPNNRMLYPIHIAAENDKSALMELLLDKGAIPNVRNHIGQTPLHIALEKRNTDSIRLLTERGADPSVQGYKGKTAIHVAVQISDVKTLDLLLTTCTDPWKCDAHGRTPLHLASRRGRSDIVHFILRKGAATVINTKDKNKRTALHIAVDKERLETIELLLGYGADPSLQDLGGLSPLHLSTLNNNLTIVDLLCRYGANPSVRDIYGRTAVHFATLLEKTDVLLILPITEYINIQDNEGKTALDIAIEQGKELMISILLENGALSGKDNYCRTVVKPLTKSDDETKSTPLTKTRGRKRVASPTNDAPRRPITRLLSRKLKHKNSRVGKHSSTY